MDLLPYLLFAFVASITPGPTNILILTNSQRYGVRATLSAVAGACVSASVIVLISGAGAGELLHQHPLVRQLMSWTGALWLSWLSWQLFNAPAAEFANVHRGALYRPRRRAAADSQSEDVDDGAGGGWPVCAHRRRGDMEHCADGGVVFSDFAAVPCGVGVVGADRQPGLSHPLRRWFVSSARWRCCC
ncbi:Cysteine/O-acetylserine efflux protein [Raoultella terrigena]|uniref:Cysteine/O-acetylserine efflux protein n=1 Tax=Raoultella terrigena TaxID=577 RepID=A0A485BJM7_RAOTE|nr:Cysteine/O-acetylserine efflux protein [Raoultella terrigena]